MIKRMNLQFILHFLPYLHYDLVEKLAQGVTDKVSIFSTTKLELHMEIQLPKN